MVRLNRSANATSACDAGLVEVARSALYVISSFTQCALDPTHPASGTGQFSKLYPHTVYTCVYVMYYIITMYYITILNWLRRSKPPGQSPKKEVRGTETIINCCITFINWQWRCTVRIRKWKAPMIHGCHRRISCNRIAGVRGGQIDAVSIPERVDGIKMRNRGFNSHDMTWSLTWLYHPMEANILFLYQLRPSKVLKSLDWFQQTSIEKTRSFLPLFSLPQDLPRLRIKSHASLPSDASEDDLQRRRVGLHNVGHPVWADMTSELTSFIHDIMLKFFQHMVPRKHEETELLILFIIQVIIKWLKYVCSWCL